MGEVSAYHGLFEIYGGYIAVEESLMTFSSCLVFYCEVFSQLKIQYSTANATHTLPCVCKVWVSNKYYLMMKLNLGMPFS
jgi:hypothetical protein